MTSELADGLFGYSRIFCELCNENMPCIIEPASNSGALPSRLKSSPITRRAHRPIQLDVIDDSSTFEAGNRDVMKREQIVFGGCVWEAHHPQANASRALRVSGTRRPTPASVFERATITSASVMIPSHQQARTLVRRSERISEGRNPASRLSKKNGYNAADRQPRIAAMS